MTPLRGVLGRTLLLAGAVLASGCSASATPDHDAGSGTDIERAPDANTPPIVPDASATGETVDGGPPDAGSPPGFGPPIVVDVSLLERWVWIPIPAMRCADDTPAGIGINFTDKSRDLLVYFQGNGVCYDAVSCKLFEKLLVGMGDDPLDHMWWGNQSIGSAGIFTRSDLHNPFRNSNFVVIPHCTIDGHSADKDSTYPGIGTVHQHGYRNVTEAFKRIVPTFADAPKVVLTGYSAGGIGVTVNYHQIASAFALFGRPAPLMINDAGPILRPPYLTVAAREKLRAGWGLDTTVGTFCPSCLTEGMHAIYRTNASLHPGLRSAQICSYGDVTVRSLYGLLNDGGGVTNGSWIRDGLRDQDAWLASQQLALAPSKHRSFFYDALDHGTLWGSVTSKPDLLLFLYDQLASSAEWTSLTP